MLQDMLRDVRPGEHVGVGIAGHLAVLMAFAAALVSMISYFWCALSKNQGDAMAWKKLGRMSYYLHALSVVIIGTCLFLIIQNHYYAYWYAWSHSSNQLPPKYLLACFWEGQEGSFLLWLFWNAVLGLVLIRTAGKNEPMVMGVFALVQVFLASMLLGVYLGDYHVGSSPFVLLRHQMASAPIFARMDYMDFIKDGNGLNPLLQNYWMVIHPPTLFLGFASTLVPFAFAISALWNKDYTTWIKPTQVWALFSAMILGTGVMMGAAWAYESLNFGGYWAWDPVENASLVPWLTLLAGLHSLIIYKHTGHSLRGTFLFLLITFVLVLYSTFLTRSGILGKTSVHAFTDLGMSGQLLVYLFALTIPAFVLLLYRWKHMPEVKKEEDISSREFWMFIGAIVLMLSALHLTVVTSLPVVNKIATNIGQWFNKGYEANYTIVNPIDHYNKFQLPIAALVAIFSTAGLFLKFKSTGWKLFLQKMILPVTISIALTTAVVMWYKIPQAPYVILLWTGFYSIAANAVYFITTLKGKFKLSGAAVAHLGFGMMIAGILISSSKQRVVSENTMGIDFGKAFDERAKRENILLYKDISVSMSGYNVTYIGDSVAEPNHYYKVLYKKDKEQFTLYPNAQINPKMGLVANPDTKHYAFKDLYTHVTSVPDRTRDESAEKHFKSYHLKAGDTIYTSKYFVKFMRLQPNNKTDKVPVIKEGDLAAEAILEVRTLNDSVVYTARPVFFISDNRVSIFDDVNKSLGLTFRVSKISPEQKTVTIEVAETTPDPDYIIMKAIIFPQINLLWLGTVIMILGFAISIYRKLRNKKLTPVQHAG